MTSISTSLPPAAPLTGSTRCSPFLMRPTSRSRPLDRQPNPEWRDRLPSHPSALPLRDFWSVEHWDPERDDTGATYSLAQAPLNSPTVFNFFFPTTNSLAPSPRRMTTPEFSVDLGHDGGVQMNFLGGGVARQPGNTNGISSLHNGGGPLRLTWGPG